MKTLVQFKSIKSYFQPLMLKASKKLFSSSAANRLVKIKYSELTNPDNPETYLFEAIANAYNKDGLGIMVIEQVPGILQKKQKLFELNHKLVNLPDSELKKVERPDLNYTVGWSYGKEYLGSKPDLLKASYYAKLRPLNSPLSFQEQNIWPDALPELKASFNAVGEAIRDIGLIILRNIDKYIKTHYAQYSLNYPSIIKDSDENTGRMLYYFPRSNLKGNSNGNHLNTQ